MADTIEVVILAKDQVSKTIGGIRSSLGGLGSAFEPIRAVGTAAFLGVGAAAVGGFGMALGAAIDMNASLEQSTMQFTTLMGDADLAAEHVANLFEFGAKTPFETGPIIAASKHLQIFGGDALNTMDNLTLVGDAAAAVGAPIDEVGFWVGRLYSNLQAGQPFGEAAMRLQELGIMTPQVRTAMEEMQATGEDGTAIWGTYQEQLGSFTGAMDMQSQSWTGLMSTIKDNLSMAAAEGLKPFFDLAKEGLSSLATWLQSPEVQAGIQRLAEGFKTLIVSVTEFVTNSIIPFVKEHGEALKNILAAIGIVIIASVIPAIVSLAISMAPIILVVAAVAAVVALLRAAWEQNLGGIQEKTAAVWGVIQPLLQTAWDWLQIHVPAALETLRAFWVDVVWPAIGGAIEFVWPIISAILDTLVNVIQTAVIPTVEDIYRFWVDTAWPAISEALRTAWEDVIQPALEALRAFIIDTVLPAIQDFATKWTEEIWPAIQDALQAAWENVIKPIWEALKVWLTVTLPNAAADLKAAWDEKIGAIRAVVEGVKRVWDNFVTAVQGFWDWIQNKVFNFQINLPELPSWAVPGSPLPIHTAWLEFSEDMRGIGQRIGGGFIAAFSGLEDRADKIFGIANSLLGMATGFSDLFAAQNVAPIEGLLEDVTGQVGTYTTAIQDMMNSVGLGGFNPDTPGVLVALQNILNDPTASFAEQNAANTAIALMEERQELMLQQIELQKQLEEQQNRLLRLEMQRQQLNFLQQQFDLLKLIRDNGLDVGLLDGLTFGANADPGALMDAMIGAMTQMIGQTTNELMGIAPGPRSRSLANEFFSDAAMTAGGRGGGSVVVNIDARGAGQGVEQDLRQMIRDVLDEYGARADIRMRTT